MTNETNNVIQLPTRHVTPKRLRAQIIGQYAESTACEHTPEQFFQALERRVLADVAYGVAELLKDAIDDFANPGSKSQKGVRNV